MSKETSTIVGQRYEFSRRARSRDSGSEEDQYIRRDPVGQHGRDLGRFLAPVLQARSIPLGGWRAGKTWRDHRRPTRASS